MKSKQAKSSRRHVADDYLELVRRFPLRPIRAEADYDEAVKILTDLIGRADHPGLTAGEKDYTDTLSQLVGVYDDKHYPILKAFKTPADALKYLMEQSAMTTTQLGELLGSGKGTASMILNGKRELSKANIRTLADRFKVNAGLFL